MRHAAAAAAALLAGLAGCGQAGNSQNDSALAPPEEAGDLNMALGGDEISPIPEGEDLSTNAAAGNVVTPPTVPPIETSRPGGSGAAPSPGNVVQPTVPTPPTLPPAAGMRPPRVPSDDTPPGQRNNPPPSREP